MFGSDKMKQASQSTFMSSMTWLANTIAVVAAFLGTPVLYSMSVGWIREFTFDHYGAAWMDLMSIVWFVLVSCIVFFVARASLSTSFVMLGLMLATKLF